MCGEEEKDLILRYGDTYLEYKDKAIFIIRKLIKDKQ